MKCLKCGEMLRVVQTVDENITIKRVRKCAACGMRYETTEIVSRKLGKILAAAEKRREEKLEVLRRYGYKVADTDGEEGEKNV